MHELADKPSITGARAAFAAAYVSAKCANAVGAYRTAVGGGDPDNPATDRAIASAWLRRKDVQEYIDDLRAPIDGHRRLSLGRKREILHDQAEDTDLEAKERRAAVMDDGKYAGDYAPTKTELDVSSDQLTGIFARVSAGGYKLDEMGEIIECDTAKDYSHLLG
jgi:hypothetical protein